MKVNMHPIRRDIRGIKRLLKNTPAYRQAGICPTLRGISLILLRVKHGGRHVVAYVSRERFETVPYKGFRALL
ncbi:MAG TPA: hypothetical protein VMV04_11595 [Thermodesulfobacteriota bacterium]|nr:hypothetical protein [Thermodesulfobacteriota bacterium]